MTTVCIVIASVVAAVGLLLCFRRYLLRPAKYRINDLDGVLKYARDLYNHFREGSVLLVKHRQTGRFIQFVKCRQKATDAYIHFGFPDAVWSRDVFGAVETSCRENGYAVSIKTVRGKVGEVQRFLVIDGLKPDTATTLSKQVFAAMDIPWQGKYTVHIEGEVELATGGSQ